MAALGAYVSELARTTGIFDRARQCARPIVQDRMRAADSLTRQLQALGFDRIGPAVLTLEQYLERKAAAPANGEPQPTTAPVAAAEVPAAVLDEAGSRGTAGRPGIARPRGLVAHHAV